MTQPLAEVFGFPPDNHTSQAQRHRRLHLCPFNNKVPNCTKDKVSDPLGVCSIHDARGIAITCPVRFRQDWQIAEDAARFFFPPDALWTSLTEIRLNDAHGQSAGNIDMVLVSYDQNGRLLDFGAVEIQGVYISGNVRRPFEYYMDEPEEHDHMDWSGQSGYPRADYLSSSRKRLAPQLLFKGGILHEWQKKIAVVLHSQFFETLPPLEPAVSSDGEIAWLVYDLAHEPSNTYQLTLNETVYTHFSSALETLTHPVPGPIDKFTAKLQSKLEQQLENDEQNPPDAPTLADIL